LIPDILSPNMTELTRKLPVWRYRDGWLQAAEDMVAVEAPLEIRLNGEPFQVLMRLPGWETELALGFLFTEGIVRDPDEVVSLCLGGGDPEAAEPPRVVEVELTDAALARRGRHHLEVSYSGSGPGRREPAGDFSRLSRVASDLTVAAPTLLGLMERLHQSQAVFPQTGGTHAVALASPDGQVFIHAEDVGRHNAMDKVIGRALKDRLDFSGLVALLSGRVSLEMALKTIRAGIPILAAVSAPTSLALQVARELHLTIAAFVRGPRLSVYTVPERVSVEALP
jgi:FdhD protein